MVIHYLSFMFMFIFSVMMLLIEISQARDFADMVRSTIDFAISLASLSDGCR